MLQTVVQTMEEMWLLIKKVLNELSEIPCGVFSVLMWIQPQPCERRLAAGHKMRAPIHAGCKDASYRPHKMSKMKRCKACDSEKSASKIEVLRRRNSHDSTNVKHNCALSVRIIDTPTCVRGSLRRN